VAEAMHEGLPCDKHRDGECAYMPKARAAWDAMAEGLGLREDTRTRCTGCGSTGQGSWRPLMHVFHDPGAPAECVHERRLVSKWEPQP
jgi:hypothetical protein